MWDISYTEVTAYSQVPIATIDCQEYIDKFLSDRIPTAEL